MKPLVLFTAAIALLVLAGGDLAAQKKAQEAAKHAKVLQTDKDPDKRVEAARELADIGKVKDSYIRPFTAVLVEAFKADKDTSVRVAAGSALLVFDAAPKEVVPAILAIVKNEKEPGAVLAVAAQLAAQYRVKDAVPDLQGLKKREEAKEDPKLRDQRLLRALNLALQALSK